jgi:imidazolonepropionase-like amidohydrolase
MSRIFVCFSALALISSPAFAHDVCIVGAQVFTVSAAGSGEMTVCVDDGRISLVAPADDGVEAAQVVDGEGLVVTPGLIEASSSVGLVEIWAVPDTVDTDGGGDEVRSAFRAVDGVNPRSTVIDISRAGGITTVYAVPSGGLISGLSVGLDLVGETVPEMEIADSGLMWASFGPGAGDAVGGSRGTAILRYRELFEDARLLAERPEEFVSNQLRALSASRLDLAALLPVVEGQTRLVLRASSAADIEAGLAMASEYGLSVAFEGAADAWSIADQLAAADVPVLINPLGNLPESFDALGSREDAPAILAAAGVDVILTTGEAHNARTLRQIAGNAVRAGLPWDTALQAVTINAAALAGIDEDYGSIEVGKVANLVVWSGDPFELSTRVEHVFVRGVDSSLSNRQTELFERYRERLDL